MGSPRDLVLALARVLARVLVLVLARVLVLDRHQSRMRTHPGASRLGMEGAPRHSMSTQRRPWVRSRMSACRPRAARRIARGVKMCATHAVRPALG